MKGAAFVAMAAWLVLFGCDDSPSNRTVEVPTDYGPGYNPARVKWDKKGCDSDSGKVDVEGEKGRIIIDWDYAPAVAITGLCLTFVIVAAVKSETYA